MALAIQSDLDDAVTALEAVRATVAAEHDDDDRGAALAVAGALTEIREQLKRCYNAIDVAYDPS